MMLLEQTRTDTSDTKELSDIRIDRLAEQIQAALLKLHLVFTAETHRMLAVFGEGVRDLLLDQAGEDGTLDAIAGFSAVAEVTERWRELFTAWQEMFGMARWEAGALPFGGLARQHQAIMAMSQRALEEQELEGLSPTFEPQLRAVLDAAARRVYSDGFQLSERIWRLDRDSLEGIRRRLLGGIANGDSAWQMAQDLEAYLGADADCPRWTSTRLYKLTPTERMTSRRGLKSRTKDTPCESKGVSYNALRLARNEIQIAHHAATDAIWARVPWIEKEQVLLSPDHPPIGCECEDVVAGGENGEGVYPKGEIELPIHVQCLCFKIALQMAADQFVDRLRVWIGGGSWPEMDGYADYLGLEPQTERERLLDPGLLLSWGTSLVTWLWGDQEALQGALGLS